MQNNKAVLLVEDSKFFVSMLKKAIETTLGYEVVVAYNYADGVKAVDERGDDFLAALLDVNLPDGPNGEIVEYVSAKRIPTIVFTGGFDGKMRDKLMNWNVVDYVLKDNQDAMDNLFATIRRLDKNAGVKVIVAEDSNASRQAIVRMLTARRFQALEAENGQQALELFDTNPDARVVITDYNMPIMDGFELIKTLREHKSKEEVAIIGMSARDDSDLSAKMLKLGANDFINKPFFMEEFHCRIDHSLEMLDLIATIRDMSTRDDLTQIRNRRYFFSEAPVVLDKARIEGKKAVLALLNLDRLREVNESYGHDMGDQALITFAQMLRIHFREMGVIARLNGDDFCVMGTFASPEDAEQRFGILRSALEKADIDTGVGTLNITVSAGLIPDTGQPLQEMLKQADDIIYQAKSDGRNRIAVAHVAKEQ